MAEHKPHLRRDHAIPPEVQRQLSSSLMRRQAGLSLSVSAIFIGMLLALPLVNYYAPNVAQARIIGFPASWLFLAVLFYPVTWLLSWIFIKSTERIEADCAKISHEILDRTAGTPTKSADDEANR